MLLSSLHEQQPTVSLHPQANHPAQNICSTEVEKTSVTECPWLGTFAILRVTQSKHGIILFLTISTFVIYNDTATAVNSLIP